MLRDADIGSGSKTTSVAAENGRTFVTISGVHGCPDHRRRRHWGPGPSDCVMWWHMPGLAGPREIDGRHRISGIFVAVCMVLLGAVLYLGRKGDVRTPAIMALAELPA